MKLKFLLFSFVVIIASLFSSCGSGDTEIKGVKLGSTGQLIDLEFSPEFTLNDSFTLECKIKLLGESQNSTMIFGTSSSYGLAYGIYLYDGKLGFGVRSMNERALVQSKEYNINEWLHLTGVYAAASKQVSFYIDGVLIGTATLNDDDITLSKAHFKINVPESLQGAAEARGQADFIIRDVRLFNIAVGADAINNNLHHLATVDQNGLIGYWPMDHIEGDLVLDKSSFNRNGRVLGGQLHTERQSK